MIEGLAELLLDVVGESIFFSWRLFLCLVIAAAVIACIYSSLSNHIVCFVVAVPVAVAGLVLGIYWASRKPLD